MISGLLINDQADRLEWLILRLDGKSAGYYRVLPAGKTNEAEAFSPKMDSAEQALDWLRREARARGFDARGIK